MTKTIEVNGTSVDCSHEVATDAVTGKTFVRLKVKANDADGVETEHRMTIGPYVEPNARNVGPADALPIAYDQAAAQRDLDAFRQHHAAVAESNLRAKKFASSLE
jgi:hypothetical protein